MSAFSFLLTASSLLLFRLWTPPADLVLCPFRFLTGLPCPLCGITRGLCALAKGEWTRAIEHHAGAPLVFLLLVWVMVASGSTVLESRFRIPAPRVPWTLLVTGFAVYGVMRIVAIAVA